MYIFLGYESINMVCYFSKYVDELFVLVVIPGFRSCTYVSPRSLLSRLWFQYGCDEHTLVFLMYLSSLKTIGPKLF